MVEDIWDSIVREPNRIPLTEAQKEELDKSLEAYYKAEQAGSSWIEVKAGILSSS